MFTRTEKSLAGTNDEPQARSLVGLCLRIFSTWHTACPRIPWLSVILCQPVLLLGGYPRPRRVRRFLCHGPAGLAVQPAQVAVTETMADALTPRLTDARPIKLTTPRCPTA
jgi:hypothetical protein